MSAKTRITGLVVALMALSVPLVWADNGDLHHGQKDHMIAKVLNLTADQQKQLNDSQKKQKETMKSILEQMKTNREAFETEIAKATPDMAKIAAIQTQIKTIQSQMVDGQLNSLLEIKKIMTPEQFAGYMALEKSKRIMMHRHGKFGHKDEMGKDGDSHKHGGDKEDQEDEK